MCHILHEVQLDDDQQISYDQFLKELFHFQELVDILDLDLKDNEQGKLILTLVQSSILFYNRIKLKLPC